jgi:uncharacterized protein (DUF983 family)
MSLSKLCECKSCEEQRERTLGTDLLLFAAIVTGVVLAGGALLVMVGWHLRQWMAL